MAYLSKNLLLLALLLPVATFANANAKKETLAEKTLEGDNPRSSLYNKNPYQDLDQDGIADKQDFCANTALNTKVDSHGCELDSDKDGIYDKTDQCPNTPLGTHVNFLGCEGDEDSDKVVDSKDKCAGTPLNTKVNTQGCKIDDDTDGDGIYNAIDQCPNTPKGTTVNKYGCKPQLKVIINATFPSNSAFIPAEQKIKIEQEASKLKELQPDEVALITGFTDSQGTKSDNLKLSWARANNVRDLIITSFDYPKAQFLILGKGEADPIASNLSASGRQKNRRIEFEIIKRNNIPKGAKLEIPAEMTRVRR